VPRHPNPELEQRILGAASRLWARGGEKLLTMRAVAKAAGTTTPTVYERYHDRGDILRALRMKTRKELFATVSKTRTLRESVESYLKFALENPHAYSVLFDGVGQPPSLYEPWPSFNLMRERLAKHLGGTTQQHNRLMMAIWALMHGTAMLIIRGEFDGALRNQTVHACIDTMESLLLAASRGSLVRSGPKWPRTLILGEGARSSLGNGNASTKNRVLKKPSR